MLSELIEAHAYVNVFGGPGMSTPLINAAFTCPQESLKELLKAGADINLTDNKGYTALIVAAMKGDAECLKFLLESGADILHVSKQNTNALQAAFIQSNEDCCRILIGGVSTIMNALKREAESGNTPVALALQNAALNESLRWPDELVQNEGENNEQQGEMTADSSITQGGNKKGQSVPPPRHLTESGQSQGNHVPEKTRDLQASPELKHFPETDDPPAAEEDEDIPEYTNYRSNQTPFSLPHRPTSQYGGHGDKADEDEGHDDEEEEEEEEEEDEGHSDKANEHEEHDDEEDEDEEHSDKANDSEEDENEGNDDEEDEDEEHDDEADEDEGTSQNTTKQIYRRPGHKCFFSLLCATSCY
jgi:hypothetical protein